MSVLLFTASAASFAICGLHVVGGGAEIHRPIQASALAVPLRAISAVLWHAVTVVLLVMGVGSAWLGLHPEPGLAVTLMAICVGWSGLFLWYGRRMLNGVMALPQWILFLPLAVLIGWGMWG